MVLGKCVNPPTPTKCEVIVASSAQTGKRAVFSFMNEWGGEVSKLIEDLSLIHI